MTFGQDERQRQHIKQLILAEVLEDALGSCSQQDSVVRRALDVSAALDRLSAASQTRPPCSQHAWLAGSTASPLGVDPEQLVAQTPSAQMLQEGVQEVLPGVEHRLAERCRQLAATSSYDSSSYDGLADHLRQLVASSDRRPEVQSWQRAADAAQQAVQLLAEVNEVLVTIVGQYKLQKQKEADEAKAAYLHAQCCMLLEKLRVVVGQLHGATYTAATLPALRRVAQVVDGAVEEVASRLREASTRLARYQALGPKFEALAKEHVRVQQQIAETHYQLREVEEFAKLQQVLG